MSLYCEYCGSLIEDGSRFCSSCGAPAPAVQNDEDVTASTSEQNATIVSGGGNYSLILLSLGNCAQAAAADLLEDTLGYSETESADLFSMLPAQIAQKLTKEQANYLARAMTEYGMEVSVSNGAEYVTVDDESEEESVFDKSGSFLGKVLSVLGAVTGLNRMKKFRRLDDPRLQAKPYRNRPYQNTPPVHVRRDMHMAAPLHDRAFSQRPNPVQNERRQGSHASPQAHHPGSEPSFGHRNMPGERRGAGSHDGGGRDHRHH